jgi:hypothetical protein
MNMRVDRYHFAVAGFIVFTALGVTAPGTAQSNRAELSVEESYLQQSVENMIIRDQSRASSREEKMIALDYIEDAIGRGNSSEEVRGALEYLALEGILHKTRENGRLTNNFPDVRMRAVNFLGELGTEDAKNTLIKLLIAEPEPMVITEAFRSLAKIGINNNGDASNAIAWVLNHFESTMADERMAFTALDTFEQLAETNDSAANLTVITTLSRLASSSHYNRNIRDRARAVLEKMRLKAAEKKSGSSS